MHSAYLLGRDVAVLDSPYQDRDKIFAAVRLDDRAIESARFEHCTFSNVSFKGVSLRSGDFLNCVFIGCYFRRATLSETRFVGCKFIDCDFPHINLLECSFRYSTFVGCFIPYAVMEYSLPQEPNLREVLARNLALEAAKVGAADDARRYRMSEIRAKEEHLLAAVRGRSQWYLTHFDPIARAEAGLQYTVSLLHRYLLGYGEQLWVLFRNLAVAGLVVFPVLFAAVRPQLSSQSGAATGPLEILAFSLSNILPGIHSNLVPVGWMANLLAGLESLFGLVMAGLVASYVFRWSLHR